MSERGGGRAVDQGGQGVLARLVRRLPQPPRMDAARPVAFDELDAGEVVLLSSSELDSAVTMRQGFDLEFARRLAAADSRLKPVLVYEPTGWVLDGCHRVLAARLTGASAIAARLFRGDEVAALVEAVRRNLMHGRVLTLQEREGAARAMLAAKPDWSDRFVGGLCGVSPKTVAALRSRATEDIPQLSGRLGRDGRVRPLNPAEGRQRAAEVIALRPEAPLRVIAALAQTSQATALDVRRRLQAGHSPVPDRMAPRPPPDQGQGAAGDPAFLSSEKLAAFARWFDAHAVCDRDWAGMVDALPVSRLYEMIDQATAWQTSWDAFIDALRRRARQHRRTSEPQR